MRTIPRYIIFVLLLSTFSTLAACERTLSGNEKAAVLAFSEAVTDNLFAGLNANDYGVFSRDFDSDMLEQVPDADFAVWKLELDRDLGNYLSRQVDRVLQSDEYFVVVYQAKFEQAKQVTVTVAFHADSSISLVSFETENYSWSAREER